jgi:colicin import membrane protein
MRSNYIILVLSALTLGFGVSLWDASGEAKLQSQATHMAEMALAAQTQVAALNEELAAERKTRELAVTATEAAEEQLALESKARETAQLAHDKAAERAAAAAQGLAEQTLASKKLETRSADLEQQLELANAKIAAQIAARKDVQVELYNAKVQFRTLSAQLQQEISDKEASETALAKAEAEAKAKTEKLALAVKAREAASNTGGAPVHHRIAIRRQKQAAALRLLAKTLN